MKHLNREILLGFWKVHILHHAGEEPICGQGILEDLRQQGYEISPGTLYPMLQRMERLGWLKGRSNPAGGQRARKDYHLTAGGRRALHLVRDRISALCEEVVAKAHPKKK